MAAYDYRCRVCDSFFEVRRGMADGAGEVQCPRGHADVARVWSAVALAGVGAARTPAPAPAPAGGACCGGGCCG